MLKETEQVKYTYILLSVEGGTSWNTKKNK